MEITISKVRAANPKWFSRSNKKFFNDISYFTVKGKATGKTYLARSTYAWTDMMGDPPRLHYRLNEIDQETLKVGDLIDVEFGDEVAIKDWLVNN